ncbi:MAG TPA: cyclic nucleotide-binding domain-containing protein [Gemmataceae bacterium]|jgi:Fe-S-cluster-containing dehydrogenase component/CRP-like cAMP-binding protein|nr:cyclic nucleotide-binding domain-containing protein [Gemmataceae bacterium]
MNPQAAPVVPEQLEPSIFDETESLFARDDNDEIVRRERATAEQFKQEVTLKIDGVEVKTPRAVPATDFLGNERRDKDGNVVPRSTTIYDVATKLGLDSTLLNDCIPILCHREHLSDPVAVCRVCSVHVSRKGKPGRKLVPACQHLIEEGMEVTTRRRVSADGKPTREAVRVDRAVRIVLQLLATDHLHPDPNVDDRYKNELQEIAGPIDPPLSALPKNPNTRNRPIHPGSRQELTVVLPESKDRPYSSGSIVVNHDNCVLCDRCVRSCTEVKKFAIIGHSGKGYKTRIAFDLDRVMHDSNCTQCGECATACPTGALVFRRRVAPTAWTDLPRFKEADGVATSAVPRDFAKPLPAGLLTAKEAMALTLRPTGAVPYQPLADIPFSYLKWNEGAVRRLNVKVGDFLCREGEYASTAFVLESGEFEVLEDPMPAPRRGLFGLLPAAERVPGQRVAMVTSDDVIIGEMACLTGRARGRSLRVVKPGVVYEVTRNILDMIRRTRTGRNRLDRIYRQRAADDCLRESRLFRALDEDQKNRMRKALMDASDIRRCEPGERIVAEGAEAGDFYILRLGFAHVTRNSEGRELHLSLLGPGAHFGEIALLWEHWAKDPRGKPFRDRFSRRLRTASVTARDPVELLHVPGAALLDFLSEPKNHPIRDRLVSGCLDIMESNDTRVRAPDLEAEHVRLGLYQGQRLLVLNLERCTRCDECTRACADSHGGRDQRDLGQTGFSRMLREGLRFDQFLVATCCRSCHMPYCLEGCPVDAIHRKGTHLEVVIDNHCIGCGLCERNCPYGAIQMAPISPIKRKAVNCDMCTDLVPMGTDPFCVRACPHDAIGRPSGDKLLDAVRKLTT